jgi:hypothetical protein
VIPDSGGSVPAPDLTEIAIDLDSLADFASLMSGETESNLSPYADRIISDHTHGVCFGTLSASAELQATRRSYHNCLNRSVAAMRSYVEASRLLVTAIETVAERYASVDALSAQRADQVAADLILAVAQARVTKAAADAQAEAEAEAARINDEIHRRDERLLQWEER